MPGGLRFTAAFHNSNKIIDKEATHVAGKTPSKVILGRIRVDSSEGMDDLKSL
jgi:hypothetical protein